MDELQSKHFPALLWPERESACLYPLAGEPAPGEAKVREARERLGAALDDPAMTLSTLLLRLAPR